MLAVIIIFILFDGFLVRILSLKNSHSRNKENTKSMKKKKEEGKEKRMERKKGEERVWRRKKA